MTVDGVGILGIGTCLPPAVRGNDWWPPPVVDGWRTAQRGFLDRLRQLPPPASAGARAVVAAMLEQSGDPFEGSVVRHVLADDASATDLETAAAEAALARAGIAPGEVDALLVHTAVPDHLLANTGCPLHHRLGLPASCLTVEVQASAYSFLAQLAVAVPLVETGRARHALLVQSSAATRLVDPASPLSPRFGDAATAVVLGPVAGGHGVLAAAHHTDGSHPPLLVAASPAGRWYDGRSMLRVTDPGAAQAAFLASIDDAVAMIAGGLAAAGLSRADVDFLAVHHATPWFGSRVREHAGLAHARAVELYPSTAYVFAASVPLALAAGEAEGALRSGDVAVLVAAGTGTIRGATVLRWGGGAR
jgi:3-oxoacyl-[acyl-carrier-protein] synthase-3